MPQSLANADTFDAQSTNTGPVQTWFRPWREALSKFPLSLGRKAVDDTISLPPAGPQTLEREPDQPRHKPAREAVSTPSAPQTTAKERHLDRGRESSSPQSPSQQRPGLSRQRHRKTLSSSTVNTKARVIRRHASEPFLRDVQKVPLIKPRKLAYQSGLNSNYSLNQHASNNMDQADSQSETHASARPFEVEDSHMDSDQDGTSEGEPDDTDWQRTLKQKWILNLSMSFHEPTEWEKFFLTYAEEANRWRRLTVSIYYTEPSEPDSLEHDLKTMVYKLDKSRRIYEAIHDTLPQIRFLDTVTNLKLGTTDGRLHVHVTEDVHETIPYPPISATDHLSLRPQEFVRENSLYLDSHLSGFVYKIRYRDRFYAKKEIPAPEMVEEFLYEVNALYTLRDEPDIVNLEAIVVDNESSLIKGVLLSYASRGALVDYLHTHKNSPFLTWERREKWARQIISGLSAIHEHGFVQGDFTLSNIVIDSHDDAKVIDLNRRGCPLHWEPPEFVPLLSNKQRISMHIGVKSDLYQLGMVLWGIAMKNDEPEFEEPPLNFDDCTHHVPSYYQRIVELCLKENPTERVAAIELLRLLDSANLSHGYEYIHSGEPVDMIAGPTDFAGIAAPEVDDLQMAGRLPQPAHAPDFDSVTYVGDHLSASNQGMPQDPSQSDSRMTSTSADEDAGHDLDMALREFSAPDVHSTSLHIEYGRPGEPFMGAGGQFSGGHETQDYSSHPAGGGGGNRSGGGAGG